MATVQEILDAAQSLPPADRVQLIHELWDSISADDCVPFSDEWIDELNRRSDAYDKGQMTASPWPEVRERLRRHAGLDD